MLPTPPPKFPFLSLFSPPLCLACEMPFTSGKGQGGNPFLCEECDSDLDEMDIPGEARDTLMQRLQEHTQGRFPIDDAYARYRFHKDGHLQKVIHAFKYDHSPEVARFFGFRLGQGLARHLEHERFNAAKPKPLAAVVTGLPLHPLRKKERGYNQAELLAEGVASALAWPQETLLTRVRYTETQTGFSAEERKENMKGVFEYSATLIPEEVWVIDDVLTTGATLLAVAEELKRVGIRRVGVATLALAVG